MTPRALALCSAASVLAACLTLFAAEGDEAPLKVLLIDGQNNHDWKATTPVLEAIMEGTGRFEVEVATSPAAGEDLEGFAPSFEGVDVVVSNYNGELWGEAMREAFEAYVAGGGGFVAVHAADNAFPEWDAYNKMIGVGGWGRRNEKSGPLVRVREGKVVTLDTPGAGGGHGPRHEFLIEVLDNDHPVTAGLPPRWRHAEDELYERLRGPAENLTVLATAFASPDQKGSGEHEPMLMALDYGEGRVFHTTLGHDVKAMSGVGFQESLVRGTEWAATGKVTFPDADAALLPEEKVVYRNPLGQAE